MTFEVGQFKSKPHQSSFNEQHISPLLQALEVGILVLSAEAEILYYNRSLLAMTGLRPADMKMPALLKKSLQLVNEDGVEFSLAKSPLTTVLHEKKTRKNITFGIKKAKSQELVWFLVNVTPVVDDIDKSTRFICSFTDITERKKAEETLKQSEKKYRELFNTTRQQQEKAILLDKLHLAITSQSEIKALYRQIVEALTEHLGYTGISIFMLEKDTPVLQHQSNFNVITGEMVKTIPFFQRVIRTGKAGLLTDFVPVAGVSFKSLICVPILEQGQVTGLLNISGTLLTEIDLDLMESVTTYLNVAISRLKLFQSSQRRLSELTTVQTVAKAVNSNLKLEEIFQTVVDQISSAFGYLLVSIYLLQDSVLKLQAQVGYTEVVWDIRLDQGVSGRVASKGQAEFVQNADEDPNFIIVSPRTNQAIIVPLKTGNSEVLGTLAIESNGQPVLTEDDLALLTLLADQISVAIENANLFATIQHDLQEKAKTEALLLQSRDFYLGLLEDFPALIWRSDKAGNSDYVNNTWCKFTGRTFEQEINSGWLEGVHPDDRDRCKTVYKTAMLSQTPFELELRLRHHNGEYRWVADYGTPIIDMAQNFSGYIGCCYDITERLKRESELLKTNKLESLGHMAGKIAHDFNNILMGIMGNLSLAMLNTSADNKTYKYLEQTEEAVVRARGLTSRLLTFSSGGAPVKKCVNIIEVLRESVQFVLQGTPIKFHYEPGANIWQVELDQEQFNQAIQNITMNAVQSMHQSGELRVGIKNTVIPAFCPLPLAPGKYVLITVQDTGEGISPQSLPKIFDPYFTTKHNGSGLGLAACYSIVRQHGGHITVESTPGEGSLFEIYLPVAQNLPELPSQPVATPEIKATKNTRILIMDDEPLIRQTVGMALQRFEYLVETAGDGAEAVDLYQKATQRNEPFNLVIMDLTVPSGMGGKEAVQKLLEFDPKARVIVSSGYSDDPVMANYRDYGFKGVAAKPYTLKELLPVLEKVLA